MASTYSPLLRIQLMQTGDQPNTWGDTTNTNLSSIIEQAIAGAVTISIPDTNYTLTTVDGQYDQSREMILIFTGSLSAPRTVIAPSVSKLYVIKNATTGGHPISIQTSSFGDAVAIPNGRTGFVYSDSIDFEQAVQSLVNATITGGTVSNLSAPIAVTDGGTGADNATNARINLNAAVAGVNTDITGLAALITPLTLAQGGTNASNAAAARTSLEAAKSGSNSDITSLTGLTTPLSVAQGGTGDSTIGNAGSVLYSTGTKYDSTTAGTSGQALISKGTNAPAFETQTSAINYVIDGGGAVYATGLQGYLQVPFNCTITSVSMLADVTGSTVIDVWKDTYANYPPTVADSICAAAKPTISASNKSVNSTLTGWTTSITAGDVLAFNVDSVSTITRVTITLNVNKA